METIDCVLCGPGESAPLIEDNGFVGRQCATCGLIFVSPRPSATEMAAMYEEGRAYLSAEFFVENAEFVADRARAAREVRRLRRFVPSGRLLEVGPGNGTFLVEARRAGFQVYGVELNPAQAAHIRERHGIPCVQSMDAVGELGPDRFDVVYLSSVLSHLPDPVAEFERYRSLLEPGGHVMFETGNVADMDPRFFRYIESFQYPDHLFFFGNQSISMLLERSGLRLVNMWRYSTLPQSVLRAQIGRVRRLAGSARSAGGSGRDGAAGPGEDAGLHHASELGDRDEARVFHGPGLLARQALELAYLGIESTLGAVNTSDRNPQTFVVLARRPD